MVGINLKQFQIECVEQLIEETTNGHQKEILVDSPTGSGKTIIVMEYIDRFLGLYKEFAVVWLTPRNRRFRRTKQKQNE